jgi:hypothetical protein
MPPEDDNDHAGLMYVFTHEFRSDVKQIKLQQQQILLALTKGNADMAQIDDEITALQASVAADTTVVTSAETLIGGISAQIAAAVAAAQAAGATAAQLAAISAVQVTVDANKTGLAAAVAAGTPAAVSTPISGSEPATSG